MLGKKFTKKSSLQTLRNAVTATKVQKIGKGEGITDWNFKVQAYKTKKTLTKLKPQGILSNQHLLFRNSAILSNEILIFYSLSTFLNW